MVYDNVTILFVFEFKRIEGEYAACNRQLQLSSFCRCSRSVARAFSTLKKHDNWRLLYTCPNVNASMPRSFGFGNFPFFFYIYIKRVKILHPPITLCHINYFYIILYFYNKLIHIQKQLFQPILLSFLKFFLLLFLLSKYHLLQS